MKLGPDSPDTLALYPHKDTVDPLDWKKVHKNLLPLAYFYVNFCEQHGIPVLFSSIIRGMIPGVSKTDIHAKGRAFDASAKGWTKELKDDFEKLLEEKFKDVAAIAIATGRPNAIEWHDAGRGDHAHLQVRP